MSIHITTLVENCVYDKELKGEHGLSLFVETNSHRFLFDTGASDLLLSNANVLGIDLRTIDFVVLSHGHRDHTGWLESFLKINTKAKIVAKKEILNEKFTIHHKNGLPKFSEEVMSRFCFIDEFVEYVPGVYLIPNVAIIEEADTHFRGFFLNKENETQPDYFDDELSVILNTSKGQVLLTACSHRGVTNIVEQLKTHFNLLNLKLIIGGFHLRRSTVDSVNRVATYLLDNIKGQIGVCHCSGVESYALLKMKLGNQVFYNYTGNEIKIES